MQTPSGDLFKTVQQLVASLQQLSEALNTLSQKLGLSLYERHNTPFGPSEAARDIWERYGQYTTLN